MSCLLFTLIVTGTRAIEIQLSSTTVKCRYFPTTDQVQHLCVHTAFESQVT